MMRRHVKCHKKQTGEILKSPSIREWIIIIHSSSWTPFKFLKSELFVVITL